MPVKQYTLAATFHADHATAMAVRDAMELAAVAVCGTPTPAQASALFHIAGGAVVRAADAARGAGKA